MEAMDHENYHQLEQVFLEGYRTAQDKTLFLRLSHIPFVLSANTNDLFLASTTHRDPQSPQPAHSDSKSSAHTKTWYLQKVNIVQTEVVGQISPAFASQELIHHILPHKLVESSYKLTFTYVHNQGAREFSLAELLNIHIESDHHH